MKEKSPEEVHIEHLRAKITRKFHKACADYGLIEDGDHILVGLSGGKDSLALVELLGRRAKIYKPRFTVTALHVRVKERNYVSDVSYLESFCRAAGVPLLIRDVEIGERPNSQFSILNSQFSILNSQFKTPCFLCAWYRRKTLFNVAQEIGCNKIAFGHHRDDILRTLLMNLIYEGAFATMPPKLQLNKMPLQIIRPLSLIDEDWLSEYAALMNYRKQLKLCPFEHVSARDKVKHLLEDIKALNPEAPDNLFAALTNIKADYLPPNNK